jgi:hypothetical protein
MSQQIQITGGAKVRDLQDVIIGSSGVLSSLAFDVANGVPKLDSNGKILVSQLPNSVMEYKGTWDAATNTPTLANGTGNQGDVYLCNVAGTVDFGAGAIAFVVSDQAIYSGSIWQKASGSNGTVTSVAVTESGDSLNITGSPITTSGTINIGFNGTNLQYVNGAGNLTTFPILTGFVPYTGATANVDLGVYDLTADLITGATGSFASSGGSDTFAINHSSGGGIALNITKGGNGEGLYINKTSGSGNAATIVGTLEATTLVKSGGTSSQFLKADGTVDSNTYALDSLVVHLAGTETITGIKTFSSFDTLFSQGFFSDYAIKIKKDGFISLLNGYVSIGEISGTGTSKIVFGDGNSAFSNSLLFNTSSDKIYTFPNANGTVALTSDLSAYVTLAGTETITGAKTFSGLTSFTNTSGINLQYGAYINKGNTPLAFSSGNTNIYSDATTNNIVIRDNLSIAKLEFNNSTQTYTFPAATGTVALTSDLSSYVPYSGATGAVNLGAYDLTVNGIKVGIGGGSGANNTRLGSDTLSSLTTASNNVAIGANALFSATSGNANAGIGANALYAITTGIINTAIGFSAGSSITTGSYNTIVGKYVGTATLDSNVVLADGIGNLRFVGFSTGNVYLGAGTTLPTDSGYKLDVNGTGRFTGTLDTATIESFSSSPIYLFSTPTSSNYEVLAIDKSATDARIRVYKSGTGSYRNLIFETGGSTKLTLDASGNLGLGVTPSAWRSTERALQIGATTSVTDISNFAVFRNNNYVNSSGQEIYITTNGASALVLAPTSEYRFLQAAAGTAGNIISFTQAMTLTAAGNLGIGTASPSAILDSQTNSGAGNILNSAADVVARFGNINTNPGNHYGSGLQVYQGTGTLGSGYAVGFLNVSNNSATPQNTNTLALIAPSGMSGGLRFYAADSSADIRYYTANTERMRITSGGNVLIGTSTDDGGRLTIKAAGNTSSDYAIVVRSSTADLFYARGDGYLNTGLQSNSPYYYNTTYSPRSCSLDLGGGIGYVVSTRESKGNIESIKNIDFINQLNPVQFNYRKKNVNNSDFIDELYEDVYYGFIADEVEKVNKDLVFYDNLQDGTKKLSGVEYNSMIAILTKAIQEQQKQIEELKLKIK